MQLPPLPRRSAQIVILVALFPLFFLYLYLHAPGHQVFTDRYDAWRGQGVVEPMLLEEKRWRTRCEVNHEFEEQFGRANLRLSRGYEGEGHSTNKV
jgi:hypothetical protein